MIIIIIFTDYDEDRIRIDNTNPRHAKRTLLLNLPVSGPGENRARGYILWYKRQHIGGCILKVCTIYVYS